VFTRTSVTSYVILALPIAVQEMVLGRLADGQRIQLIWPNSSYATAHGR
jgi:hypothetical protein